MSKIDELLKNEKVEWKKLGEVSTCFAGGTPKTTEKSYYDGEIPWIRSGEIKFNIIKSSERNITIEGLNNSSAKLIRSNSVVLAMTGATVGRSAVVEFETSSNQSVAAIETDDSILNYKFLFYYLASKYEELKEMGQGALTSLNLTIIKNLKIPIPSLKTQGQIVKILDKFTNYVTDLQAELQTELQARNKQYEYYRDMLLSEEYLKKATKYNLEKLSELNYFKLYELVDIIVGSDVPKDSFSKIKNEKYNIPIYSNGTDENSLYGYTDKAKVFGDSITISARGTIGYVSLKSEPYYPIVRLICLIPKNDILNLKFLYYFLQQYRFNYVQTGIPSLTSDMVRNIKLPIPNKKIQNKVVEVLDKFQDLLSDTQGLLPEEIEQRQKQYEYYREKLLTFEDKSDSMPHAAK